jgi:glycosyltransferase involved in cell wall biosynthesis
VVIPYGYHGEVKHSFIRHDYGYHGQIIGVGAVIEQRNFIFSMGIFKELLKEFPNLKFKIIGHVYYTESVKRCEELGLGGKVIFSGELPHGEVLQEMERSDIYMGIFSGKYVGLGTATIESMLMGVPVVANVPSDLFYENRLQDMEEYAFADTGRADEVKRKVSHLLRNEALREKIGKGGQNFVRTYLNWECIAEKVGNLMEGLRVAGPQERDYGEGNRGK